MSASSESRVVNHLLLSTFLTCLVFSASAAGQAVEPTTVVAVSPAPPPPDPRALFNGGPFRYAGGAADQAALDRAIEHVVEQLFLLIRPIARGRLHGINPVYPSIAIHLTGGLAEVSLQGAPLFRSPDNGARTPWRSADGEALQITQRFEPGHIVQEIIGPTGTRRNEYVLSPDGHTLMFRVRIVAQQLPSPIVYALTYRR